MNRDHEENIQISTIEPIQGSPNEPDEKYLIPLSGKWIINQDPILIGKNFQTLTNMRYVAGHPEGILGMTKINTSVMNATYYKTRSAFHFNKAQYPESHVLVQAFSDDGLISVILDNDSSVPNTDIDFSPTRLYPPVVDPNVYNTAIGNFSTAPNGQVVYCDGTDTCIWGGNEMIVSAVVSSTAAIAADCITTNSEDYSAQMQNTKQDTDNVIVLNSGRKYLLVGSVRPLKGVNFYISSGSLTAKRFTCKYHDETTWTSIDMADDITGVAKFTFASTVGLAAPIYIDGYFLYWYQFHLSSGTATIYSITLDAPFQKIINVWDGLKRSVVAAFNYNNSSGYEDQTTKVLKRDYVDTDTNTFWNVYRTGSGTTDCMYLGFTEEVCGVFVEFNNSFLNVNHGGVLTVEGWNGASWVAVTNLRDGTNEETFNISFSKAGLINWQQQSTLSNEQKKIINNSNPYYWYRFYWSNGIWSAAYGEVRVDYIAGIPSHKPISGYSFPLMAANRLMLGCDIYGRKNLLNISADGQPQVFNGSDSYEILFGDEKALTCGTSIFAQYASSIYNMAIIFKNSETWSLVWTQGSTGVEWTRYQISPNVGCPAPRTLKTVSAAFENNINNVKVIAIWRGEDGIYISNGQSPLRVSHDIDDVFDQTKPLHVNNLMANIECSFVDQHFLEYHWLWASNENTTLDQEFVLDLKSWKWYNIDRTTGKKIQVGIDVIDTYGNYYSYGFIDTGYMEWLEDGTTFDGEPITNTLVTGELVLVENDILQETSITRFNLITLPKNIDTIVTLSHTMDGSSIGTNYTILQNSLNRYKNSFTDMFSGSGIFHTLSMVAITSHETKGFEPLNASVLFKKERTKIA